eukprot:TRINITY_DN8946_c0_g1_i1.p1 TRINITY_DN8946_c0_g1~~TRINITY_DN8946_c0_g1_i1.p1  ORF type:complete len:302 (-),score=56.24 TRINITY_DN8946_c0_g1_i1:12-917(-)
MEKVSQITPSERQQVLRVQKKLLCKGNKSWHHMAYTEWTNTVSPSTKTIVMVHGLTSNSKSFDVLAEYLTAKLGHKCICPDVVGRGNSSWLADPLEYNYERYVADIATLISSLHTEELYYVGTSMGGIIGMFLSACPGVPFKKMVINDIGSFVPKEALERIGNYVGKNMVWEDHQKLKEYVDTIYKPFGLSGDAMEYIFSAYTVHESDLIRFHYDPKIAYIFSQNKEWKDLDLSPFWNNIDKGLPVLIIHGINSDILSAETISKMKEGREETTESFTVENVGHAPMLFDLIEVERITAFLQ